MLTSRLTSWAFARLSRLADSRPPDLIIRDDKGLPYLKRWWVIPRNRVFNIYLHQFLGNDPAVPHDHPWWSLSWMLKGKLWEQVGRNVLTKWRLLKRGDIVFRSATFAHRLMMATELGEGPDGELDNVPVETWTLFITGPRLRVWGFWCPKGWITHKQFAENGGYNRDGAAGCGEHG